MEIKNLNTIVRDFLDGKLSKEDRKIFLKWVSGSKNDPDLADVYLTVFEQIEQLSDSDIDLLYDLLEKEKLQKSILVQLRPVLKYASIFLFLCGVYFVYQWTQTPSQHLITNLPATSSEAREHILPDGSKIILYGDSEFEVVAFSEDVREISLRGHADFIVVPDEKPFYVRTESGYFTKVLGTRFTVREGDKKYSVEVQKGRVSVGKNKDVFGVLSKGDSLVVDGDIQLYSEASNPLLFDDISLAQVIHSVNQTYDSNIVLDKAIDGQLKCNATFEKDLSVIDIVHILCEMHGFQYSIQNQKIIIQ